MTSSGDGYVRLAGRAALPRFDETLPQLLSGSSCRRIIAAVWGSFDVVTRSCNSLCQKYIPPVSPQPTGLGRREFALIAPLFFGMLFAIIETAIVFFAGQVLEQGTAESRAADAHASGPGQRHDRNRFKTDLCNRIKVMFNCEGNLANLTVDVKVFAPGTAITITDPIVSGNLTGPFAYSLTPAGSPNTVVVRAFYQWPLYVTRFGYNISNLNGSKRLLASTAAFHVEP